MSVSSEQKTVSNTGLTATRERLKFKDLAVSARKLLGRTALSLGIIVGPVTADILTTQSVEASIVFENNYPDMDANDCSATYGTYTWCKGNPQVWYSSRSYAYRNCTDGAAYWVNEYTDVNIAGWDHAKFWDTNAASAGYTVKGGSSNSIEAGDIAQSDDGEYGHVGFVIGVTKNSDGVVTSITIAELNAGGEGEYRTHTYTDKNGSGKFIRYGSYDWDHFIDVNGTGEGLNDEDVSGLSSNLGGLNDVLDATGDPTLGWRTSIDGETGWHYDYIDSTRTTETLLVGDFDNDGEMDDVMDTTGDTNLGWRVSKGGKLDWQYDYLDSSRTADSMIVGDFDHDGFIDDILDTTGDPNLGWRVSENGSEEWHYDYMNSSRTADTMFVGDFDHDGFVDDILDVGSELGWRVSEGGRSAWNYDYRDSTMPASELAIGDFDNDGYLDDVFNTGGPGVGWRVSYEGKSDWDDSYSDSSRMIGSLILGEFSD